MRLVECPREQEVLLAARDRVWSDVRDAELTTHIEQCEICRDLVTIASLAREQYVEMHREAQVPSAGQVWWRAAVRARAEAAEAATRPMTWIHGVAAACAVGLAAVAIGAAWPSVSQAFQEGTWWLSAVQVDLSSVTAAAAAIVRPSIPLLLAGTFLVLAPIALYFALSDE